MPPDSTTRRNLISSAALLPLAAVKGTAANSAVTVGLIGSGGRGTFDSRQLVQNTTARVTAICDIFDERIDRAKKAVPQLAGAKPFHDYSKLLESDVDAVIIATPVFLHPEHLEAAIRAGKHVYIEKPAGLDVEGCKRVIRASDSADRKLNITFGFQQRYGQGYLKARQLVASGAIGRIRMAHSHWIKGALGDNQPGPAPANYEEKIRQWHVWKDTFGDIIVETYCHGIDVLNWFLGGRPLKAIGAGGRTAERRGDISDHCDVTFSYPDGVDGVLTGAQLTPSFYRSVNEQFFGETGVIETAREYWTIQRSRDDRVTEKSPREITIDSLEAFVQRIRDGKPENTGVRSAESTLTAILGRMATEQRREITWEEMMKS